MPHVELINDNFQNFKCYNIRRAQLVIADIPYNLGKNAYASNPSWYVGSDNSNGPSARAGKEFFHTDGYFRIAEFMHFCSRLLIKEPKEVGKAPAMIVFCAFDQAHELVETGAKYGFMHHYPIFFIKQYSPQVLKSNMKIVGATEMAMVLYRDKLPKFNNNGRMVMDWFQFPNNDLGCKRVHPTQKPVCILKRLIEIFTDKGDVVIDPCAGSGSTLRAAYEMGRHSYGFEIDKKFYHDAMEHTLKNFQCEFEFPEETIDSDGGEQDNRLD